MKSKHEKPNYLKIVEWSDEDDCYVGSAPPLIGQCCHGDDEVRFYKELCVIVDEWIDLLKKDGHPLPDPMDGKQYSGKFVVRMDPAFHRRIAAKAKMDGESLNQFVVKALVKS